MNRKGKIPVTKLIPTLGGLNRAQDKLIMAIQQKGFAREFEVLNKQSQSQVNPEAWPKSSSLAAVCPFVDCDGLLMAGEG